MHPACYRYVARVVDEQRLNRAGLAVCEIGAYDVNGSVRPLFADCASYVGVDLRAGKGVDVVADGATYGKDGAFDVVVTTSALEHYADPAAVIANARRILKPGGHLIVTTVGHPWGRHSNDGTAFDPERDTYSDITIADLAVWLEPFMGGKVETTMEGDILAHAITRAPKAGKP